ncbi:hypothetical protein C6A37_01580 [Desulfobacteraceae bacterium SEEP-SAG9]|nr:hypothetical protein C6A37_01580 [Desulfobacteraceae bacterium SEEP-SAG9]
MKVLLISNMFPSKNSYSGVFIKRQVEDLENDGIKVITVVKNDNKYLGYVPFIFKSILYLIFKSYDLVHAHYGFHSALMPAIIKRKPLLTTFHGSDALIEPFRNSIYYFLQKFTISRSDHIIAVSNDVRNSLISNLNADPEKISIVSCGVNTSIFVPLNRINSRKNNGIAEDTKAVLFAGDISYMKGVDVLYQCARLMPNVLFILIGNGKFRSNIKNCKFVGPCSHDEMPMWMNTADVLVLPSRSEGLPTVILEALSCGTPVIASNVGGCPDIVQDGHTGFIVPIDNAKVLQEKISDLLTDDNNRVLMGMHGRKRMIDEYDNKKIAKRIKQLYRNTISSRKSLYAVQ